MLKRFDCSLPSLPPFLYFLRLLSCPTRTPDKACEPVVLRMFRLFVILHYRVCIVNFASAFAL